MEQLTSGDRDVRAVGAEFNGIDGALEGDTMEHDSAAQVDEEAAAVLVDGEEEDSTGGRRDSGDVGRRLDG